ncbi:MAG TPA: branched-chain amino acid ABC transporter permease, partial [Acidiphilium sp.]
MTMILGKPVPLLFGQLLLGIINGSFYAILSLGLAIIFGLLNVINFAHGALFMVGAFVTWGLLHYVGVGFWPALVIAPVIVGVFGLALERWLIRFTYKLDILYGLLLTFGLALVLVGLFTNGYGSSGVSYNGPEILSGTFDLGFMFLPVYRGFVIVAAVVVCFAVWFTLERTSLGATLRAATENPALVQAFGINVPRLIALTFAGGVALAGFAGVLAAPLYSVNPDMGTDLI